ncbi:MAG: 30S ribosomal protein S3 [Candidatus Gracilibacteria bacterium]|nr:30S ribosomal protein S3 [Candidatus Gracilibacteria bacterium]MDD3119824.1 30S ribosomal protein S3 [Candidatus Gracilibacteria bacterium]MDD4530445.1 30S ribosomal protein S3 [Candidatus Gracilibacteria bacterium]
MGHKVSPVAFRIGYIKTRKSIGYYNKSSYGDNVSFDVQLRITVKDFLKGIPVGNIFINHTNTDINVVVYTSKIALVTGTNNENTEKLQNILTKKFPEKKFSIDVKEVKKPETNANIVAFNIARQIEKRLPYRRVVKNIVTKAMEKGALGIKIRVSGRLNGVDIARSEVYKEGNIPSQTIRSDIDYTTERADTIYGVIGVKVWIYKGDIFKKSNTK